MYRNIFEQCRESSDKEHRSQDVRSAVYMQDRALLVLDPSAGVLLEPVM